MSSKNLITSLIVAVALSGAAYLVYQYLENRKSSVNVDGSIDAKVLYEEFRANQAAAFAKYSDKPIKIKGVVATQNKEGGTIVINLDTENALDAVACGLDVSVAHEKVNFEAGEEVIFKGICNGIIENEVRISNCVLDK
jgi:hypothetical protein